MLYAKHKGVAIGESTYVVGREDEIIKTTPGRANVIKKLIERGYSFKKFPEPVRILAAILIWRQDLA